MFWLNDIESFINFLLSDPQSVFTFTSYFTQFYSVAEMDNSDPEKIPNGKKRKNPHDETQNYVDDENAVAENQAVVKQKKKSAEKISKLKSNQAQK